MRNKIIFSAIVTILLSLNASAQYNSGLGYDDFRTDYYNNSYGRSLSFDYTPEPIVRDTTSNTTTTEITTTTATEDSVAAEWAKFAEESAAKAAKYQEERNNRKAAGEMAAKNGPNKQSLRDVKNYKVAPASKEFIALITRAATPGYTENTTAVSEGYGE